MALSMNIPADRCIWNDVSKMDNIRKGILQCSSYPKVADLPNVGHDYTWNISKERNQQMYKKWNESLFYKKYAANNNLHTLDLDNMYGWDAAAWGFMTTYEKIFTK